jgi:hypothetical protein
VPTALELWFDIEGDAGVRTLWAGLARLGVPSLATATHRRHRPHVPLAVVEAVPAAAMAPLTALAGATLPLAFALVGVDRAPAAAGAVVLAARPTDELVRLRAAVVSTLAAGRARGLSLHAPRPWAPHCPLTLPGCHPACLVEFGDALVRRLPLPVAARSLVAVDTATGAARRLGGGAVTRHPP